MWHLIRLTFRRWRGQQQRIVDRLTQTESRLNVSTQVRDNDLVVHSTVWSDPSAIGRQCDVDDPIHKSERRRPLVKNEWSVRSVANQNYSPFLGARIGVVSHNNSYRFWEWDTATVRFVPLVRSRL